jgi:hypothetical protein
MSPAAGGAPPGWARWSADGLAVVGHERAQTGSGESLFVIVRSTAGRTVVDSESDAWTPWFLMFPVTAAVLKIEAPAVLTTRPWIVTVIVPPGFSVRTLQVTCGALTKHPPVLPIVPFATTWLAMMLDASRLWVPSVMTTSSARVVAMLVTWSL